MNGRMVLGNTVGWEWVYDGIGHDMDDVEMKPMLHLALAQLRFTDYHSLVSLCGGRCSSISLWFWLGEDVVGTSCS